MEEFFMDENIILGLVEELAQKLGIKIRYESMKKADFVTTGGLCRLGDDYVFIINSKATKGEKIKTITAALKRFDLTQVYIRPALREFLENIPD
jgi:N-dimethylarginine dimethylaminohydrolase